MFLQFVLDLVFPKKCVACGKIGVTICPDCFSFISPNSSFLCPSCTRPSIDGLTHPSCRSAYMIDGIFPIFVYKGTVKRIIYKFKYKPYLEYLKTLIGKIIYEEIIQNETLDNIFSKDLFFCPIPLSKKRELKRGYNQADLIAQDLALRFQKPIVQVLLRSKETKPMFELSKEERLENIKGAFVLNESYRNEIKGKVVVLVDDLVTTGATMRECAKVLKRNGATKVYGLAFAKEL